MSAEPTVVAADEILGVCRQAKTDGFDFLQDLSATDHPAEGKLRVVYSLYSYRLREQRWLKVELDRMRPVIDSVEPVWKAANWLEREVFDLFGVTFRGHPDLRRILLPTDWVGHPLRKDYVEQGGYRDISNVRDNPLDQFLEMDKANRPPAPPPAPAAVPAVPEVKT